MSTGIKPSKKRLIALAFSILLLIVIEVCKRNPAFADTYFTTVYRNIMVVLNGMSSVFPFSLYDVFILVGIVFIFWQISFFFRKKWASALLNLGLFGVGLMIFFELSWGINYFSSDFFTRNNIARSTPDSIAYKSYVTDYIEAMNHTFQHLDTTQVDSMDVWLQQTFDSNERTLGILTQNGYRNLNKEYVINTIPYSARAKQMLFGNTYAGMGILGYYGPFFSEAHLNPNLLPHQIPFTYAHEMAHLAGITSEAEANFYAFKILTKTNSNALRFSAYYSLLPHVLNNAGRCMPENEYKTLIESVDPNIIKILRYTRTHWDNLYSPLIGQIQDHLYNYYLQSNNIPSGLQNYSEVVELLVSTDSK
ncbi:MAG: DUF3810 domain-containing protein [Tannerellaceae bacterium]